MPFSRAQPPYDPATLAILQQAYDEACRDIGTAPHSTDPEGSHIREALAKAIMHVAATGVRDPRVLRERAVHAVMNPDANAPAMAQPHRRAQK